LTVVYLPPAFSETRTELLIKHIESHEFGLLVSHGREGLIASQIPFLVERRAGRLYLQGHLARPNPQAAGLDPPGAGDGGSPGAGAQDANGEALAIFAGPHAYVSPTWYEAGLAVPTWNYAAVHAYGAARWVADPEWLHGLLRRLTDRHEAREPAPPWRMEDLPERYLRSMLNGIIGVEIRVNRLEGKFKLSQNRPAADRPRIIAALERREDPDSRAVARLMREREPSA
jgi:transcriptional regulator